MSVLNIGGFMTLGDWNQFQQFLDILTPEPVPVGAVSGGNGRDSAETWPDIVGDGTIETVKDRAASSSSVGTVVVDSSTEDEDDDSDPFDDEPEDIGATCTVRLYHKQSKEAFIRFCFDPILQGPRDVSVHEDYIILVLTERNVNEIYGRDYPEDDSDDDIY